MKSSDTPAPATTREQLLQAAAELFAERGVENVSIREIAAKAGVRHGGVNYHFRSKRELYLEVLERYGPPGARIGQGGDPALRSALEVRTADDALPAFERVVRDCIRVFTRPRNPISDGLMYRELSKPEGPDEQIYRDEIELRLRAVEHLLGVLAPHLEDPRELRLLAMGVLAQGAFYRLARPVALRLLDADELDAETVAAIAERVIRSALAAIRPGDEVR